ncbi:hypothetical protein AMTR_s00088p00170220 [Amborella trichopoda]|uniref:FRIGIDA-like protein n=1 Tax=Amborella trichopoda TaxID=13333 RepID=W1NWH0_AMBTC|nr:hypothetical protein AMTR_s00088p00170220 [Amborella trichopoda]
MDSFSAISEAMKAVAKKKENLHKAFEGLISHGSLASLPLQWKDIEAHFHLIEKEINEKLEKLSEKEKLMPKPEMIQQKPEKPTENIAKIPAKAEVSPEKMVAKPGKTENTPVKPENSSAGNSKLGVKPKRILKTLCEKMDAKGLLKFIIEHRREVPAIRYELPMALRSAPNSAELVLDCVLEFYPTKGKQETPKDEVHGTRRACILLLERLSTIDSNRNPDIKERAMKIAGEWKKKVYTETEKEGGTPTAAHAFLQLLATYGLASGFDADDLFEFISLIGRMTEAPDLCRALGFTPSMPGKWVLLIVSLPLRLDMNF